MANEELDAMFAEWDAKDVIKKREQTAVNAKQAAILEEHAAVVAAATPLGAAVLALHGPWFYARSTEAESCGCESTGYDSELAEFPCPTYVLVRDWES